MKKYRVKCTLDEVYEIEAENEGKAALIAEEKFISFVERLGSVAEVRRSDFLVKATEIKPPSQKRMVKKPYEQNAYEVWCSIDGRWTWYVLKKYQNPEHEKKNEYARWFCLVKTPIVPEGELGDVYVKDIKANARRVR